MALVNHAKKEINAKIVYYGPAESGKNNALTYIYSRIKPSLRGELKCVPAGADNLLFFDFSPFEEPMPNGYRVRLHVYTLTGKVSNPATWKMTLKGTDGIIIMANPAVEHAAELSESVSQLRDFLSAYGVGLHETPAVLQLNSFSHGNQSAEEKDFAALLDLSSMAVCRSNADNGEGLIEALTTLSRQVLDRVAVKNEHSETETDIDADSAEPESAKPARQYLTGDSEVAPHHDDDIPRVTLLSREIVSNGKAIRIPLEIVQGSSLRRVVVTVNVELE